MANLTPEEIDAAHTAYHEAGHVLGSRLAGIPVKTATILLSGNVEGHVQAAGHMKIADEVIFCLLGHAAVLEFGYTYDGHSADYEKAVEALKFPIRHGKSYDWAVVHNYIHREDKFPYEWEGKTEYRYKKGEVMFLFNRYDFPSTRTTGRGVRLPE